MITCGYCLAGQHYRCLRGPCSCDLGHKPQAPVKLAPPTRERGPINLTEMLARCPMLTYRRLDYWCANGIFGEENQLKGSGNHRRFNDQDVDVANVLARVTVGKLPLFHEIANQVRSGQNPVSVAVGDGVVLVITSEAA